MTDFKLLLAFSSMTFMIGFLLGGLMTAIITADTVSKIINRNKKNG